MKQPSEKALKATIAASLVLVFGSSLPLKAQPKAPEVTVANPVLKRVVQWEEYTGQFEAVRRVGGRPPPSRGPVKNNFTDGPTREAGGELLSTRPTPLSISVRAPPPSLA